MNNKEYQEEYYEMVTETNSMIFDRVKDQFSNPEVIKNHPDIELKADGGGTLNIGVEDLWFFELPLDGEPVGRFMLYSRGQENMWGDEWAIQVGDILKKAGYENIQDVKIVKHDRRVPLRKFL